MKKQLINLEPVKEQVRTKLIEKYNSTIFMNTDTINIQVDIKEILKEYIESKHLTEPTVYITTEAYVKMRKLVDGVSTEIGWYGTVTKCPGLDNVFVIEDILVYPQTVTGVTCEQDDDKMFGFEMSLTTDQVNHKRFQGHSHVNMGVTPSGVDEQFYQDLLTQVTDYFIITVTNKNKAYTTRFYDIANNILYSDVPIKILLDDGTDLDAWFETAKNQLHNRVTYTAPNNFKGSVLENHKTYTAKEQAEHFKKYSSMYDYEEEDDPMIWDKRFGYIRQSDKDWYDSELKLELSNQNKPRGKRGRPRKNI